MKKVILFSLSFLFYVMSLSAQVTVDEPLPSGNVVIFDSFEHGNYWIWGGFDWFQYDNIMASAGANVSLDWSTEGRHSLECILEDEPKGQCNSANWFFDGIQDFSGAKYIAVDVYNPVGFDFELFFVIQTTKDWNWNQTATCLIPPGKHTIVYDVTSFENLQDVRRIAFMLEHLVGKQIPSHFYIDNIRFIK